MPLHVRSIAVSISVLCFFGISLIGWLSGLSPYVCCKRAILGAIVAYLAGSIAVKVVNAILIDAMITHQQDKLNSGDSYSGRND